MHGPAPVGAPPGRPRAEPPRCRPRSASTGVGYRSSNLGGPLRLGDTGEIPVVRVPRDTDEADEDARLYPPRHWVD